MAYHERVRRHHVLKPYSFALTGKIAESLKFSDRRQCCVEKYCSQVEICDQDRLSRHSVRRLSYGDLIYLGYMEFVTN
jgi:hypothetical protein